jgi:hypothetical protein
MADDSLPYLGDITITQKLPSDGSTVPVAISWTVKSIRPSVIEIYAVFQSGGSLLNNLLDTVATSWSPITVRVPNANRNPTLYVGVAPRNLEADGVTKTDEMVDATGEPQKWETFVTEGKVNVTYTNQPPTTLSPPNIQVQSFVKTLHTNDYLSVTVSGANASDYHLIVNSGGSDGPQMEKSDGNFPPVPSVPGKTYALRAQQYYKGVTDGTDPWSPFSTPILVVANARVRSVRTFLSISGVLNPGTGVRQFAGSSTRGMMGV